MNILEKTSRKRQTTISVPVAVPGAIIAPADADQGIKILINCRHRTSTNLQSPQHPNFLPNLSDKKWCRLLSDLIGLKINNVTVELSGAGLPAWSSEHFDLLAGAGIWKLPGRQKRAVILDSGIITGPRGSFIEYRPANELIVESVTDLPPPLSLQSFWYSERDSDYRSDLTRRRYAPTDTSHLEMTKILGHLALIKPRLMGRMIVFRPNAVLLSTFINVCLDALAKNKTASRKEGGR